MTDYVFDKTNHFVSWFIFIILIIILVYTAYIVRTEKKQTKPILKHWNFFSLTFSTPPWWITEYTSISPNGVMTFTHEEQDGWKVILKKGSSSTLGFTGIPETFIDQWMTQEEFVSDDKQCKIPLRSCTIPHLSENIQEGYRFEGTGTVQSEHRYYLDIIIFSLRSEPSQFFLLFSQSSVLGGLIEGPYFELMLQSLRLLERSEMPNFMN